MERNFHPTLLALLILCGAASHNPGQAQQLVLDGTQDLPGLWAGQAAWGDYDGDGDLDLALIGETLASEGRPLRIARIYRNHTGAVLSESPTADQQLVGAYYGDLAWGDYDGDGDLDLAIAGWDAGGDESLRLYASESTGEETGDRRLVLDRSHVDASGLSVLRGVRYAALAWGDCDGDGDLDLAVSGMEENGTSLTQMYRNEDGVFRIDAANSEALVNFHNGALAWGDYDGDGDLDLAVSGENVTLSGGLREVTEFYRNEPAGILALDSAPGVVAKVKGGAVAWADYDGDGNLDLAVNGRDGAWNASFLLYRNRPRGVLTQDETFQPGASRRVVGDLAWGDYDNDGDPDLAVSGRTASSSYQAFIFQSASGRLDGSPVQILEQGLAGGTTAWGDYDGDGDLDLLLCGVDAGGQRHTHLYDNQAAPAANDPPTPVRELHPPRVTSDRVLFSWGAGADRESAELTYNLRVGTEPGGGEILSGAIAPGSGNAGSKTSKTLERALLPDIYYWSVQSVDGAFARSAWSQEGVLNVQRFVHSDQRLRDLQEAAMAWGDYDGDGDYDLVLLGQNRSGEAQSLLYENVEGRLTAVLDAGLAPLRDGDAAWGDYDRDGDLDLLLTGVDTFGNGNSLLYAAEPEGDGFSFDLVGSFPSLVRSAAGWGDYDGDGDLDLALLGLSDDVVGGVQQSYTRIFVNDSRDSFVESGQSLIGLNNGDLAWGDYDGDGDLDLAVTGSSSAGRRELRLYRNEEGQLVDAGLDLAGLESSALAWGDYDGDGDLDLAAGGIGAGGVSTTLYVNDSAGGLAPLQGTDLPGIRGGALAWGDYDNDQDLDLIIAGNDGEQPLLRLYENTGAGFVLDDILILQGLDFSAVSLADYDADGDLDLVSAGRDANLLPQAVINDNLVSPNPGNRPPEPPAGLAAVDSADAVRLSWQRASDEFDATPQSLTYNLRVGTSTEGSDVLSGNTPLGPGNAGHSLFHRLRGLVSGTYFWSVQSVDDGYARSAWSAPQRFVIDTVSPQVDRYVFNRRSLGIGQTVTLALAFLDEHSGVDAGVEPEVNAVIDGQSYPFEPLQFTGSAWSGALTIAADMPSGAAAVSVRGVVDGKGNAMAPFVLETAFEIDAAPPAVVSSSPASGADGVPVDLEEITIAFSEPLDPSTISADNFAVELDNQVLSRLPEPQYDPDTRTVRFSPMDGLLAPGSQYGVKISAAIQDMAGNRPDDAITITFSTRVPSVERTAPQEGETVRSGFRRVQVTFSGPVDVRLIIPQNLRLSRSGVPLELPQSEFLYDSGTFTVSFPAVELLSGSAYQAVVSSRMSGPLGAERPDWEWSFRTQVPRILSTRPAAGEDGVSVGVPAIQIVFSEPVARQDAAFFQTLARSLEDSAATPGLVPITSPSVRDSADATILSFIPEEGLQPFTEYQVSVDRQVLGELAADGFSWTFRTAARLVDAGLGGTVTNASRTVELYLPPSAMESGTSEIQIRRLADSGARIQQEELSQITAAYEILGARPLRKPATLTMRYAEEELNGRDVSRLGIFRRENDQWQRIGGASAAAERAVRTAVDRFGVFAIFEDMGTPVGALSVRELDCQPRAFFPAGGRDKAETDISFILTGSADVTVRVYNASGRLERVIARDEAMAPGRIALQWDGRDDSQKIVPSGLYIIVVNAGGERREKVVAVVR